MKKLISLMVLVLFLCGCKGFLYLDLEKNRGASLERVLKVQGEPMERTAFDLGGDTYDILFYRKYADNDNFNPFVFKNKQLEGWGMSYYKRLEAKR